MITSLQLNAVAHAAATHLLNFVSSIEAGIAKVETSDPIVASAVQLAIAEASQIGIPMTALESLGRSALGLAQAIAAATASALPDVPRLAPIPGAPAATGATA